MVDVWFESPNATVCPIYGRCMTSDPPQVGGGMGGIPPLRRWVRRGCWVTNHLFIKGARTGKEQTGWNTTVSKSWSRKLIVGVFGVTVWWLVTSTIGYVRLS